MLAAHHESPELRAGTDPARPWRETRLLHVERGELCDAEVAELATVLQPGDLLVLNDAATLPASFRARVRGRDIEVRLAAARGEGSFPSTWTVVLFGAGDWRMATEHRPPAPRVAVGDTIDFGGFYGLVRSRHVALGDDRVVLGDDRAVSPRLVDVELDRHGASLGRAFYALGAPIQYSYHHAPLRLADVQTPYAGRPWAMEMPSTGRPLHWPLLDRLRARGVRLAWLTHAAGISSTGDLALDASLPLPERYAVPTETMRAVYETRRSGGRVVAVGTTVVRALESAATGVLEGVTNVRLGCPNHHCRLRVVDGILTGIHSPGESHYELLGAFVDRATLRHAHAHAVRHEYLAHEFGDLMLLWAQRSTARREHVANVSGRACGGARR
jgi:S-adenosylmethionine:tRNA ribosyltransferase-isomerase